MTGTIEEIDRNFLYNILYRGDHFFDRTLHVNYNFKFVMNKHLYAEISQKCNQVLDECALSVMESVKMSAFSATHAHKQLNAVKYYCDKWQQNEKTSRIAKQAIIRVLRRVTRYLIAQEIAAQSIFTKLEPSARREDVFIKEYLRKRPNQGTPTKDIPPKYWPFYLLEKTYFMTEPLSKILIELLESTTRPMNYNELTKQKNELKRMDVSYELLDEVINNFKAIEPPSP